MQNYRNLFVGMLISVVGMVSLLSVGRAEARKGGLPQCLEELETCQTDLDACEAEKSVVFPGDGQTTPDEFGLAHGPALSYTDNGDGTFTDNNTQLIWEKKTGTAGLSCNSPTTSDPHDVNNCYQWSSSGTAADGSLFTTFLATLNTVPCFAGHCDWRIPTVKELQSTVDYSKVNPATSVPGATTASFYWSSTSFAIDPDFAWDVDFGGGSVTIGAKSADNLARAVRGGQ